MSLYVIGKLKPDKRMIAYKIYDSETKESKLIATKDIMRAMKNGTEILGLRFRINTAYNLSIGLPHAPRS